MSPEELRRKRARFELEQAERRFRPDPAERRLIARAVVVALAAHALVLAVDLPRLRGEPERVDAPQQLMQVRFLEPEPPKVQPPPREKPAQRIPRPDPEPEKPEPIAPAPEPPAPEVDAEPGPAQPDTPGPVRVASGEGPGLIRKVEPEYPNVARVARIQGDVVLDAVIRKDGTVDEIRVLETANPLLTKSAVEALEQWLFAPSDQDVIMTLTVKFVLH